MIDRARPRPPSALGAVLATLVLGVVAGCGGSTVPPAAVANVAAVPTAAAGSTAARSPMPAAPVDPEAAGLRSVEPASTGSFALDLYRRGDFRSQRTTAWCVPAAIQTMLNVIHGGPRSDLPSQRSLDRLAWSLSSPRLIRPGSEPQGWAGALNRLGVGRYVVVAKTTRQAALRAAARAMRLTRKPVGLLVWRGAHAWVMTGFTASADPAQATDFRVTSVRVSDPWYPRPTAAWGHVHAPDTRLSTTALASVYLRWRRPLVRYAELDGRFVLVLPVAPAH
jgi:hypothetical protein